MKIKLTHPVPEKHMEAGLIYDLPDDEAQMLIEAHKAIITTEQLLLQSEKDMAHVQGSSLNFEKKKKVKHDNG